MSKVLRAIEEYNRRGKKIELYASYQADKYSINTFDGYKKAELHPINSITKFITCCTVLLVAAQRKISLNTPIFKHWHYRPNNQRAERLTIVQFANMITGIEWQEIENFYEANNCFKNFVSSADPIGDLFARKIADKPVFTYNSAVSHALSYWVEAVTGQLFENIVQQLIFKPLAIKRYNWQKDASGRVYGGHGLSLSGEDFIKLMPLLTSGFYDDQQVLDKVLLKILHQRVVEQVPGYSGYSYGLWHGKIKNAPFIGAFGNAGQRIYYFPTLKQCHAFLGDTKPEFGIHESILKKVI